MEPLRCIPWLAFLAVAWVVLRTASRFTRSCERPAAAAFSGPAFPGQTPAVTLIVTCKAAPPHLREALESMLLQDYPHYETVFALASTTDPAWSVVTGLAERHPRCRTVLAGYSDQTAEKTNNLVHAVNSSPDAAVFVFADSDIQVPRDWLRQLVAPLGNPQVGITTAAKVPWLAADAGFWAAAFIRLIFSTMLLTFGDKRLINAWGGSMAMRSDLFRRLEVDKRWARSVDDDISLSKYVRDAGLRIEFVRLFVPTRVPTAFKQAFTWCVRQVQYLWWYDRLAWATLAFITVAPTIVVLTLGSRCLQPGENHEQARSLLLVCVALHMGLVGSIFSCVHRVTSRHEESRGWGHFPAALALLSPVIVGCAACATMVAASRRTMVWGGVTYRLYGPERIHVVSRTSEATPAERFEPSSQESVSSWDAAAPEAVTQPVGRA